MGHLGLRLEEMAELLADFRPARFASHEHAMARVPQPIGEALDLRRFAAAFGTLMLSQGALLQQFGFALAFAILLDATVVRIYLVPAIVSLLGKWNWYAPGRLQRTGKEKT